jgi:hypothetical protein
MFLLFMAALIVNVIISVVAILRERETSDAEHRVNTFASELKPQRPGRAAPAATTSAPAEAPSERVTAKQALSER